MEKLLAIFDEDVLFASRLMEYFKKSDWDDFEVLLFTKTDTLLDFLKYQFIEILLCSEDLLSRDMNKENIKYIFCLCPDMKQIRDKSQKIYKYQPAGRIASDVLTAYTRLEDMRQNKMRDGVNFTSVFAPITGIEKEYYAWSLAKELSVKRKTLFISLDLLPTDMYIRQEHNGQSVSELLYYLKENKSDYMDNFKSYLNYSEKLSYLSGPLHGFDLLSINREDIDRFMEDIKKLTDYEEIIFYLGIYTEASMEVLSRSNDIYIATCESPYEELVFKEWERQAGLMGMPIKELKINRIKLARAEINREIS